MTLSIKREKACAFIYIVIETRTTLRVTNIFEKAEYRKSIFQGLIFQVLFDIETRA